MRRILPTVVPRLMASTASANLVNVLGSTGPSFTTSAACAGGAYNLLLAAMLIGERALRRGAWPAGCEETDPHFHAGFDSMRAYNSEDNDHPERASRPYAADRAGFIFAEGAGMVVLEAREVAEARGATDPGHGARVGHVERRRRRHGGAVVGRRPPRHRAGAGARATCRPTPSTT